MKIEKVNDRQIRCTLTREDLASRALKMSELAYGSDKAKDLFRDMMEKANDEYGFEADNIPLMIEAIPVSGECIVLIITKVEDPEELDTRFSKFAPGIAGGSASSDPLDDLGIDSESDEEVEATNISDLFKKFKEAASQKKDSSHIDASFDGMAFSFDSFSDLSSVCKNVSKYYGGNSSVYFNEKSGEYLLTVERGKMDVTDFVQVCNFFSEYGAPLRGVTLSESFLREHYEPLRLGTAVTDLAEIG